MSLTARGHRGTSVADHFQAPLRLPVPCRQPCAPSCSHMRRPASAAAPTQAAAAAAPVAAAAAAPARARRRCVVVHAWFTGQQQSRRLWDYQGSCVRQLSLEELQLLHRLSFGHRNQRSYLVVLYSPESPACQAFEQEVERLASGLRHERAFVAAALDVSSRPAAHFASDMLGVSSVPAVLLYPEAARGFLRFLGPDMSAPGMLAATNKARLAAWPPSASSPGAREWRLQEAAMPLAVTALRAAAASGEREAIVAAIHQQMVPIEPTPLPVAQGSAFWSRGRLTLWGGLLLASLAMLAWDLALSDAWEDWCLQRRQAARARGTRFSLQENMDDLTAVLMSGVQQQVRRAAGQPPLVVPEPVQQQQGEQAPQEQPQQQFWQAGQLISRLRANGSSGEGAKGAQQQQQQSGEVIQMSQQDGGGWAADSSAPRKPPH